MMKRVALAIVAVALLYARPIADNAKTDKFDGYAEWHRGPELIVDGQRVRADASTRFSGKGIHDLAGVQLGYEVEVEGVRLPDGAVLARKIDAKPNGDAMFEKVVRQATDEAEAGWLSAGGIYNQADGRKVMVGSLVESGPAVERVARLTDRLVPPYVDRAQLRVHVVRTKEWNAMAMGNGAIWVYSGLLDDMDDDEVGLVLGHELAHYTHEHTRRAFKRGMWLQLVALGVALAAEGVDDAKWRETVQLASTFSVLALQNGYGRDLEDQADRVGMRYAYEAGYDVRRAPRLWKRFQGKYGDQNKVANFFFGNHSQNSVRIRNTARELELNYSDR